MYTGFYTGTFDGQGHTISGLYLTDGQWSDGGRDIACGGLFGYVRGGTVKNVRVTDSYLSLTSGNIGGIASTVTNNGVIENVSYDGYVKVIII